ncbi:MAG: hypothetical protein GOVbin8609_35 [Prokaryotic dsDNA virus sp.]|mgnify:CR=1 FL=1|nr:MAG: hypothetical protein GOVbin8609_35 [Prokaryotic dsDNA virus sp.]|tara:strand:+ start:28790 stop:29185 length:396 start_codon:yes stop_codon:yes gene_type:complete
MTVTVSNIRTRFPEFSDEVEYPDERIELLIEDSQIIYLGVDENRWGGKYNTAQSYLVAHLLTVSDISQAGDINARAGAINSKSAGGVSVSRAVNSKDRSDSDDFFMATSYGQQYLIIRNSTFVGVMVANRL